MARLWRRRPTAARACRLNDKRRALLRHRRRGRSVDEQHGGASDRREQDKGQVGQERQERIGAVERVGVDAAGVERTGRLGFVGSGRGVESCVSA